MILGFDPNELDALDVASTKRNAQHLVQSITAKNLSKSNKKRGHKRGPNKDKPASAAASPVQT